MDTFALNAQITDHEMRLNNIHDRIRELNSDISVFDSALKRLRVMQHFLATTENDNSIETSDMASACEGLLNNLRAELDMCVKDENMLRKETDTLYNKLFEASRGYSFCACSL